jgi:DnaJ-class molecular chaperone
MPADIVCPQCKGATTVTYEETLPGSAVTLECPTCGGEGLVDAAEAYVYEQEQKAVCDCVREFPVGVFDGVRRCRVCGRLAQEGR